MKSLIFIGNWLDVVVNIAYVLRDSEEIDPIINLFTIFSLVSRRISAKWNHSKTVKRNFHLSLMMETFQVSTSFCVCVWFAVFPMRKLSTLARYTPATFFSLLLLASFWWLCRKQQHERERTENTQIMRSDETRNWFLTFAFLFFGNGWIWVSKSIISFGR